ncbi:MAG: carboxypeptidase regulatory-like domain-containing protein [Thermoplasmata archaeon]|nr:MAG: carboxypeptidase regulatory-like domain-containing protein [Thermoplasmata archaeon]
MTLASAEGCFLKKRRLSVLLLTGMIMMSYFFGLDMNARAQSENVYVDGYVFDIGFGTPIDNATVYLQNTRDGSTNFTKTNATGYYNVSIYAPPFGEVFVVTAFHEDYLMNSQYVWLEPGNPQYVELYLNRAMNKNSSVHGKILDAVTMTPLPFARVAALGDNYINTTSSDAAGYFWMALESDQRYYIQAEMDGYEDQMRSGYFDMGDNLTFNFYMEPLNCTLKGFVNNSKGALGSATVYAYRLDEVATTEYWPEVNASTGYFELNLTRGVWQVEVSEYLHYSQTLSVIMLNDQTTWQNFTLAKLPTENATVQGYVRYYHNGSGAPWANIYANNQNRTWSGYNSTNETGWYTMTVIPGEIIFNTWVNGYSGAETSITVEEGGTYYHNLTVFNWWSTGYLEGYVNYSGIGEPDVVIRVSYGNWRYDDRTDPSGYYNISVPGAPLEVQAYKNGFKPVMTQVNTTAGQTTVLNMDLEPIDWSCEVRGYINNTNGEPLEGAYASFDYSGFGWDSATGVTDYTGLYQMMVPAGYTTTFVFADSHEYKTGEVNLPKDEIYWFNETLEPVDQDARVICKFTNIYTGKPIKHTEITFSEQDLLWFTSAETDENGMVKADVPSGFVGVSINAWESGYKNPGMSRDPSTMQFLLSPSETRWLNISLFPRENRAMLHGYVNDTLANPIVGATVYLRYGDTIISNTTDSSGYYELEIPGDQWINAWVRASGYRISEYSDQIWEFDDRWNDWILEDSPASIEGPITDSAVDLDGDTKYDVLYVYVPVNVAQLGEYRLEGYLAESSDSRQGITSAGAQFGDTLGVQIITLAFVGEQIRNSKKDGYLVNIQLLSESTWELLDKTEHYTTSYFHDEFEIPDAKIEKPVEQWLVDTDLDGLYNYLIINATLNVSVAGDYSLLGPMRDIWGDEFEMAFETLSLETGIQEVQITFDGTSIYNNGETLGSVYMVLFEGTPEEGSEYIHSHFFYTPYAYDIFQFYSIDSFVSGYVTDMGNQPIEGMTVWIYNITQKYLNETTTNASGYYELGGWSGDWIIVVNDDEGDNLYQGDLTEITLSTGMTSHDFLNLPYTMLDEIEMQLIFSDWNNTRLDWLLYAMGDNRTIRFEMDVLQFGDGDGFVSEEEAEMVMGMIGTLNLPSNSNDSFLVDDIWYDLNQSSMTRDVGLTGSITSKDPVYIHLTADYIANSTIPDPSPHNLTLNCTYDDTDSGSFIGNNVTNVYYIDPPMDWGRTGNGTIQNITISGSDYIIVDPLEDPDPGDGNISEWVNITISLGISPTTGSIKGNVTLQGTGDHSGVVVTVYDNVTKIEVANAPTDPNGYYEISGIAPGNYSIVAHKAGYGDNTSQNNSLIEGETLWLDFTLFSYPPKILHSPTTSAVIGDTINIIADVTDDGEVDEVIIYYKDVGSGSYSSAAMIQIPSTPTYMGTIPAQSQLGYVDYYIWANDTKGNFATHPKTGNHSIFIYEANPPEISNLIVSPDPAEYPDFVNISVNVTDDTLLVDVSLYLEMPDLSTINLTMLYDASQGRYYINASYSMLGTYNFTIWANDSFNNWNFSSGSFIVQDTIAPTSSADWISQYWQTSSPITVDATASDSSGTGVDYVDLWYRYSIDNSTWGLWTQFQTDSSSPYNYTFNFPDGEGYYEFFSIATDYAGNPETMKSTNETLVGYDASAPTSYVDTITTYWHTTSPVVINVTASDTVSGVAYVELWYRYSIDNSSWSSWTIYGTDSSIPYDWIFNFPDGEGYYEYFSIANDTLGNSEAMKVSYEALCGYDATDPSSNVEVIDSYWHTTSPVIINATASDTVSGIEYVELWYRYSIDNSSWSSWTLFSTDTSEPYGWTFDFPSGEGYYEFYSIAIDYAQNPEPAKSSSDTLCAYDVSPPVSNVDAIDKYWHITSPLIINVTASDTVSGITYVELWYRYSIDNSSWGSWTNYNIDNSVPYGWDFDFPDGEGYYEFFSIANDTIGNSEAMKVSYEALCGYDATDPTSNMEVIDPYWQPTSTIIINVSASDTISGVETVWLYYRFLPDNSSGTPWIMHSSDSSIPYQWNFNLPNGEGFYQFLSTAIDYAQNTEAIKPSYEALCGYDITPPSSNVDLIDTYWQITSPLTINVTASDTVSGIEHIVLWYRYSIDNSSWSSWTNYGVDTSEPYGWNFNFPDGEGYYEFFSIANDSAQNPETMKSSNETICAYDITPSTSNVDGIDTYWQVTSPLTISATATDTMSGIEYVVLWYRYSIDNSSWSSWENYGVETSEPYGWNFNFPDGEGYYEFFSIANDSAQNSETMKNTAEALCAFDAVKPASFVNNISPYWRTTSSIVLDATASDGTSGVVSVALYYRYSSDGSSWGSDMIFGTDTSFPWSFSFNYPSGDGYYEFYSRAADLSGLVEDEPASADTACALDTSDPAFLSAIELPAPWEFSNTYNLSISISDISGISDAWMEITINDAPVENESMDNLGQDFWNSFSATEEGTLNITVWVVDNNGQWNSVSFSTQVKDTIQPSITNFNFSPSDPQVKSSVRVSVQVSDVSGIAACTIDIRRPNGVRLLNESMTREGSSDVYSYQTDYNDLGEHQILIWAEDGHGLGTLLSDSITTVDTELPHADAGSSQEVAVRQEVNLDASLSTDNDDIANYTWSFLDDGRKYLYGKSVQYTFNSVGDYDITLIVTDFAGNTDSAVIWINVSAISGTGSVTGTVRDKDGNPISGATVYVEDYPSIETTTDSLGRFTLDGVPTGNQTIIVEKDGYKWKSQDVTIQQDQTTPAGNIELAKSVSEEEAPWLIFSAIAAAIAVLAALLIFFLLKVKKSPEGAVIDEVFFMYGDGRLIKHFTRRLKPDIDEDILSSMLVAVQDFIKDSFKDQEGILDEMKFGRFQFLLGRGKHIILAVIVLGDELEQFKPQVKKCIEDIEENYADALEEWDGEMAKVRGASKYIMDLIDGRYT